MLQDAPMDIAPPPLPPRRPPKQEKTSRRPPVTPPPWDTLQAVPGLASQDIVYNPDQRLSMRHTTSSELYQA